MPPDIGQEPRLAAHVQIAAFVRQASVNGDFATVLRKGDPTSGTILLISRERGQNPRLYERFPTLKGDLKWQAVTNETTDSEQKISEYCTRRAQRDPDIWLMELDVAEPERLTLYMGSNT